MLSPLFQALKPYTIFCMCLKQFIQFLVVYDKKAKYCASNYVIAEGEILLGLKEQEMCTCIIFKLLQFSHFQFLATKISPKSSTPTWVKDISLSSPSLPSSLPLFPCLCPLSFYSHMPVRTHNHRSHFAFIKFS